LIAWDQYPDRQSTLQWRLVPNEELPDTALDRDFVEELFASIAHETRDEIEEEVRQHERMMRVGWWLVFVWAVLVPVGVAILEWWSDLLGLVVLLYAFFKAGRLALRLTGRLPKSKAELEKETEDLQMRHHYLKIPRLSACRETPPNLTVNQDAHRPRRKCLGCHCLRINRARGIGEA
jgi:hypothetical protein